MQKFSKQKLLTTIIFVGVFLIFIFWRGLYSNEKPVTSIQNNNKTVNQTDNQHPYLLSTSPAPLENSIITPNQEITITFSEPIENIGEFKHRLEPNTPYKAQLINDRKTITLTPDPTWDLGQSYSIIVTAETKFDGGRRLKDEIRIPFKTIDYKGV